MRAGRIRLNKMSELVISIIFVIVAVVATIIVYLLVSRPTVIPPPVPVSPLGIQLPTQIVQTLDYPVIVSSKISDVSVIVQTPNSLDAWFQYNNFVWSNKQIITSTVDAYDVSNDGSTLVSSKDNTISVYNLSTSSYNLVSSITTPSGTVISRIKVNANGSCFMVLGQTGIFSFNRIYRSMNEYQLPIPPLILSNAFGDIAISGNGSYAVVSLSASNSPEIITIQLYKYNGVNYIFHSSFQVSPTIGFGNKIEIDTDATRLISYDNSPSIYVYTRSGTSWTPTTIGSGTIGNITNNGSVLSGTNLGTVSIYSRNSSSWQLKQNFQLTGVVSSDINDSYVVVAQTPTQVVIFGP